MERSLTGRRRAIASVVTLGFAVFVTATAFAAAGAPNRPPDDTSAVPNGIGAGIYFVSGTADYAFELMERGEYYLITSADRGSTMDVSLSQNGTRLSPDWVGRSGMTLMELERGIYDLHLVGSGKVAVGWNFVFPGVQQFPANQRLVAALAPRADNRLTISLLSASVPSVHVFVYNEEMALGLDAVLTPGLSKTFDFPWSTSNFVTLVAETAGGPGNFSLGWTSEQAPVQQNSFLLPLGTIALLIVFAAIPALWFVLQRRRRLT